jgi:hypothetical protein
LWSHSGALQFPEPDRIVGVRFIREEIAARLVGVERTVKRSLAAIRKFWSEKDGV